MNTYKIINVTNLFGKRDSKFNSIVNIDYIDNRTRKVITLKPNETVYLTVQSLPLSVRKMNIKNLISVTEVDLQSVLKKPKVTPKLKKNVVKKKSENKVEAKPTSTKTSSTKSRKKTTSEKKEIKTKETAN